MSGPAPEEPCSLAACAEEMFKAIESAEHTPSHIRVAAVRRSAYRYSQVVTQEVAKAHDSAPTGLTDLPPGVEAPRLNQRAILDSYGEAVKTALEARDGRCGAIITASLSILTAYAAVITLVTPKSQQPVVGTLLPFAFLTLAFVAAAVGKLAGVPVRNLSKVKISTYDQAADVVRLANYWKFAAFIAIVFIGIGVFMAARSLVKMYAHTANLSDSQTEKVVYLNDQGRALVSTACGTSVPELTGTVTVSDSEAVNLNEAPSSGIY